MIVALICGCGLGLISAIPVAGPISALVLNYAIKGQFAKGRCLALGAAIAESVYTFFAFWGVSRLFTRYKYLIPISQAVAALIIAGLGIHFYFSKKMRNANRNRPREIKGAPMEFLTGMGISAANPTLIVTWSTLIASLYSMNLFEFSKLNASSFSLGVCLGNFAWFNILIALIAKYRDRLNPKIMDRILKTIGIVLLGLSAWIVFRIFVHAVR